MSEIVYPNQIKESFDDIGGLTKVKDTIYETVILPLQNPELFSALPSSLVTCPRGVLFYGPPGTGKTMMAKAIAQSCNATFICVRASTIENKYHGESQKLIRAVFSLAQKVAPSIIFIDEIDMFLSSGEHEHAATMSMKAELLSQWDGLTSQAGNVCVLAATNRPQKLDPAVQRRLPVQFLFDVPDLRQRVLILTGILAKESLGNSISIQTLATLTAGYSGSDLKALCTHACHLPLRKLFRAISEKDKEIRLAAARGVTAEELRPKEQDRAALMAEVKSHHVEMSHFQQALREIKRTGQAGEDYAASRTASSEERKLSKALAAIMAKQQAQAQAQSKLNNGQAVSQPSAEDLLRYSAFLQAQRDQTARGGSQKQ